MYLIGIFAVLLVIMFIVWQFKLLKKYVLSFDKYQINPQAGYVKVNEQLIPFAAIARVTVRPCEQPSAAEKALSKSAAYAYMAQLVFHLHDGSAVCCSFNTKGALYQALKQLAPHTTVEADIEAYKPRPGCGLFLIFGAAILIILLKCC